MQIQLVGPEIFDKFQHATNAASGGHILRGKNLDVLSNTVAASVTWISSAWHGVLQPRNLVLNFIQF